MKKLINIKTLLAALTVLAVSSCADEELIQNMGQAGQLHIGSVSVGDNKVASRTNGEEGTITTEVSPQYNKVVTSVDKLFLNYSFVENSTSLDKQATAIKSGDTWNITGAALKPNGNNEKWANLKMTATNIQNEGYALYMPDNMGITSWNGASNTRIYQDKVSASSVDNGGITIDKALTSATLGKLSIALKHDNALLRLDNSTSSANYTVTGGTYVKNGVAYQVTALKTLWAELTSSVATASDDGEGTAVTETIYVPLTEATEGDKTYLQAIVPDEYNLSGFKAVMNVGESAEFVLDFDVDYELAANTQYNLTLTITQNLQNVDILRNDKPGWGQDILLQQPTSDTQLKYVATNNVFEVRSAEGLLELNKWMTGNGGDDVKFIEGYGKIDQTKSKLSYNITITNSIILTNEQTTYNLDGTGNKLSNWIPLGTAEEPYTGKITVVNGAQITGLEIHVNESQKGFVGYLGKDGEVVGLKLKGNFSSNTSNFGAVVGFNDGGIVDGCETLSGTTVKGIEPTSGTPAYIGGVVGWNNTGLVTNCVNNATVNAPNHDMVGGVLGENHRLDNCVITNCTNKGAVTGKKHVGGVVGINHRVANNCHNEGSVTGDTHVGGVVGMNNDYSPIPDANNKPGWPIYLINGTNTGTVTGKQCVGGVVGSNGSRGTSGGYIVASWNRGSIELKTQTVSPMPAEETVPETFYAVGGVVGVNYHHDYTDKVLTDEQEARHGNRTSQIIACYNTGAITATGSDVKVGGVVGRNEAGSKVWASYWNVAGVNNGCGDEQNTTSDYKGKEYTNGFNGYSTMNEAITKYLKGTAEEGYGIVEGPTNSNYTKTVLIYDSTGKLVNSSTSGSDD